MKYCTTRPMYANELPKTVLGNDDLSAENLAELLEQAIPWIACHMRPDVYSALEKIANDEQHPYASFALAQLLENAQLASAQTLPLCQDTGYVWVLLELGLEPETGDPLTVTSDVFSQVDATVARLYKAASLRNSLVRDALTDRANTNDNTPVFCEVELNHNMYGARLHIMLKGGGSDNASCVSMLPPGAGVDGVKEVVLDAVRKKAANACPPLIIGVGVGSTFDKVAGLAKRALLRRVGQTNPNLKQAALETELFEEINALGIGAGGFGGANTTLAVHIKTAASHMAALPVAVNLGCVAMRSCTIDLFKIPSGDA